MSLSMVDDFWRLQVLGTAPSTQDIVKNLADLGEAEGLAVHAMQQTKGRGRHGNHWSAPLGNLYISTLLRPACRPSKAAQIAFVASLALSDTIDAYLDKDKHRKTLKWPNDILIDGKKISGILLETSIDAAGMTDYLVCGIGLNIFAPPENAISLDAVKKERVFINGVRDLFLNNFLGHYNLWKEKGFLPVRDAWLKDAHGLGKDMRIRLPEVAYQGVFKGIDKDGALQAEIDGDLRSFTAGEVHFGVE